MNPLAAYANPSIKNYAVKTGQMVTKIPLKDNTDAYLMTNDKSCEVFLLKGKEIVGGKGFRSTNSLEHAKFFKETILELQKHTKKGVSVFGEFIKSCDLVTPQIMDDFIKSLGKIIK